MTEGTEDLHPLVVAAGRDGRLPDWARCSPGRQEHVRGVRELLQEWSGELNLPDRERVRWCAAGTLHDALRDADPEELRFWSEVDGSDLLLHGPACAERLRKEGVEDEELLRAVAYHPVGFPEPNELGEYLYLADFLEPGRELLDEVRERLRAILPAQKVEALRSVIALRIAHRLEVRGSIRPETVAFWNRVLAEGE